MVRNRHAREALVAFARCCANAAIIATTYGFAGGAAARVNAPITI
jgi:hypothetical protein